MKFVKLGIFYRPLESAIYFDDDKIFIDRKGFFILT